MYNGDCPKAYRRPVWREREREREREAEGETLHTHTHTYMTAADKVACLTPKFTLHKKFDVLPNKSLVYIGNF